jgi:23S rRNA (cytidine2498-2'-O)-methyltransferase
MSLFAALLRAGCSRHTQGAVPLQGTVHTCRGCVSALAFTRATVQNTPMSATNAYLAAPGFMEQLLAELAADGCAVLWTRERLVLAECPSHDAGRHRPAWAQNVWYAPVEIPFGSIKDAARALRAMQRNWTLYSVLEHRRAALIQEQLPRVAARPLRFGDPAPTALGSWTLLHRGALLAAPRCSSPFAHGEARFEEDRTGPPNRAYLKLWELFTLLGMRPGPGDFCLDLGGSPGGWAWVLAGLGARVRSVDKAPLTPEVARLPNVEYARGSGFAVDPRTAGPVDWLFSDIACYPDRLLRHVARWLELGHCRNMVCTLKFQAETDQATAREFAAIPGSRLMHLFNNKHELTWVKLEQLPDARQCPE